MFDKTFSKPIYRLLFLHASLLISPVVNAGGVDFAISVQQYLGRRCRELLIQTSSAHYHNRRPVKAGADLFPNEQFAFDVMVEHGIVTPEMAAFFKSTSSLVDPSLVSFVNIKDRNGKFLTMLRMVKGQKVAAVDSHLEQIAIEYVDLPWMVELPELAEIHVDRTQQKFIYEWGRAASTDGTGLFQKNISLLTLLAARDVYLQRGSVDEAFVYIHTTQANAERFEAKYRFKKIASNPKNPNHVILVKPLTELIAEYDPEHESYGVGGISDLLGLQTQETLDFIYESKNVGHHMLDIVSPRTGEILGGVSIHDDSLLTRFLELVLDRCLPAKLRQPRRVFSSVKKTLPFEKVFQGLPEFAIPQHGLRMVSEISITRLRGGTFTAQEITEVMRAVRRYYIEKASDYGNRLPEDSFSEVLFVMVENESVQQPYLKAGFRRGNALKKGGKVLLEMPGGSVPLSTNDLTNGQAGGHEVSAMELRPGMFEYTQRRLYPIMHR